ncbi:probable peptidyl-tRNA hydrolase isoform X9 [Sciurus carolinensis]|uniref:probable peptidyl-tRNA hydrolase isoform X9 n=1 Tax=Sciurus carolinensis TaxID=30640 RepID=UPI001FB4AECA|nr:probable peptidyl-tRNA hydrolase isoform X9 [Sciurus carolinensis]
MGGAGLGLNGGNMSASGLSRWGLWRGLAMSRCVLEPRSPGKRWLVAGLGNHGLPGTRHSVGMAVLGQLARRLGVAESWARDQRCTADLALAPLGDAQLVLLRPRRLMNANGCSVAEAGATMESVPALAASTPVFFSVSSSFCGVRMCVDPGEAEKTVSSPRWLPTLLSCPSLCPGLHPSSSPTLVWVQWKLGGGWG